MKKRINSRAQSEIISVILLILIVISSIVIVWVVVSNMVKNSTENTGLDAVNIQLEINQVKYWYDGRVSVSLRRTGGGQLTALKFNFFNKNSETQIITRTNLSEETGNSIFRFNKTELPFNSEDIEKVSVFPVFGKNIGIEVFEPEGDIKKNSQKDSDGKRLVYFFEDLRASPSFDIISLWNITSHWKFDGDAKDNISGNNGTAYGGVDFTGGAHGNGVYVDGNGGGTKTSYVNVPNKNYLKLNSSNYLSVGLWVYLESSDTDGGEIISKAWNRCGDYNYYIQAYSPTDNRFFIGGAASYNSPALAISRDSWHYIGFTVNNTHLNVYVDGVLKNSGAHGITNWNPPTHSDCPQGDQNLDLAIGTLYPFKASPVPLTYSSFSIKGNIGNVMIFKKALTAEEMRIIYYIQKENYE